MRPLSYTTTLLAAAFALSCTPAGAATLDSAERCRPRPGGELPCDSVVRYTAGPLERNDVTVAEPNVVPYEILVVDRGATLNAVGRCRSIDKNQAACPVPTIIPTFDLGGGSDSLRIHDDFFGLTILAGAGDDSVRTGPDDSSLVRGGPGDDSIRGRGEQINFLGGSGDDRLRGSPVGPSEIGQGGDNLVGGTGNDVILGDNLDGGTGNDIILGGRTASFLSGGPGRDSLLGGPRRDRVLGGTGDDRLRGGKGHDRVVAGKGFDVINSRDGARDRVDCGPGVDRVRADRRDRLLGCERVTLR